MARCSPTRDGGVDFYHSAFMQSFDMEGLTAHMSSVGASATLFAGVPPSAVRSLMARGEWVYFQAGTLIGTDGVASAELWFVFEGDLELSFPGEAKTVTYGMGAIVGISSFLGLQPAEFTLGVPRDSWVLRLSRDAIEAMTTSDPKAGFQMMFNLSKLLCAGDLGEGRDPLMEPNKGPSGEGVSLPLERADERGRQFRRWLRREHQRAQRYGRVLSMGFFKVRLAVELGPEKQERGQKVIMVELAQIMRELLRATDRVSHFGPDAIAILLPESTLEEAAVACEKVVDAVASRHFMFDGKQVAVDLQTAVSSSEEAIEDDDGEAMIEVALSRLSEA